MSEKKQFRAIKGTRDILPPDSALWNYVEQTAREVFGSYGFAEIRLPIFEQTDLFARSIGADTDVVSKEMYTFVDRDESSVTLRPEGTASVARAFIEHGMHVWPQPVKLYYMGPMFRRERPQKGRFRQFYQIGAEVLGKAEPTEVDSETIEMLMAFFARVGLKGAELSINSIGDALCRPAYVALLQQRLRDSKNRLSNDSQRRIETNPLRVLDSKLPQDQDVIEVLPKISESLCEACSAEYRKLKEQLDLRGIHYIEDWRLVRGLDYYMRTTFEITATGLGSQNAVCGGGRYDGLIQALGGPETPGFGFAIGTDRLILSLQEEPAVSVRGVSGSFTADAILRSGQLPSISQAIQRPDLFIAGMTRETWDEAIKVAGTLRKRGLSVYLPKSGTKLPRVFETAEKMGTRVVVIIGENELRHHQYTIRVLKPLIEGAQRDVSVDASGALLYGKIVKLRQDLEKALSKLVAWSSPVDENFSLSRSIDLLKNSGVLPTRTANEIAGVVPILNQAIHGAQLADASIEWALANGNLLLNELEKLNSLEETGA